MIEGIRFRAIAGEADAYLMVNIARYMDLISAVCESFTWVSRVPHY